MLRPSWVRNMVLPVRVIRDHVWGRPERRPTGEVVGLLRREGGCPEVLLRPGLKVEGFRIPLEKWMGVWRGRPTGNHCR